MLEPSVIRPPETLVRPRINALLADAVSRPLTIVCAGAGYGKTRAVCDFTRDCDFPATWMQFSARDNAGSRFWTKYIRLIAGWDEAFIGHCRALGFPDTEDKLNRHLAERRRYAPAERRLIVLDDIHLIKHTDILLFLDRGLRDTVENTSVIAICREVPRVRLVDLQIRGLVSYIGEDDLCFTEGELALFLRGLGLSVSAQNRRNILGDTNGWAFSVDLVARSLKNSPGYAGYVRIAMKQSIFQMMETEVYDVVSERLRRFLVRLSLVDHLSADLIAELAQHNAALLDELGRQHAYIRYDSAIHAYFIHHLFLDFLRTRQNMLTRAEVTETFTTAARWCAGHGFEGDALGYWEKVGDYKAIVATLSSQPVQMPPDIAAQAVSIFENAPDGLADSIELFAVTHVRVVNRLGRWKEAQALMRRYEERFLRLPGENAFRNRTLGVLYYTWGNQRALLGVLDDRFDFADYYEKMDQCLAYAPVEPDQYADLPVGFWVSLVGSSRSGAPQRYIEAATRAVRHISHCWPGATVGLDVLCLGELFFYRGAIKEAEPLIAEALCVARANRQFEIEHKALFYLLRLAIWQGNLSKAQQTLTEMEARLGEDSYAHRYINYDIALGWYFCALRLPDMVPVWLAERFAPYDHAYYIENTANQIKARYRYLTRDTVPLLTYIGDMKRRESVLYGRIELLALEACARWQRGEKTAALEVLRAAYEEAAPNALVTPFIELGKDMRTLAAAALRSTGCGIPPTWLETVERRATSCAKRQSALCGAYEKACGPRRRVTLSKRESEILADLYHGLSRAEIAANRARSINTVNAAVNNIFAKLGAHSIVDAVRIAAEEKLV